MREGRERQRGTERERHGGETDTETERQEKRNNQLCGGRTIVRRE